ncbi:MAG: APC family permease [Hyphomonadaceae bacterium]|nr:APC family permease [Hyphomonadaceae bacterium]
MAPPKDIVLKRDIGVWGAAIISINGIVGAGIFALPQAVYEGAGDFSPYLFPIFGLLFVSLAFVFFELASRFDAAGGPVVYANAAFGPLAGFQTGWLAYLARVGSIAANTNAFLTYLAVFAAGVDQGATRMALIVLAFVLLVGANVAGVKLTVGALTVGTVIKIAPLAILAIWGVAAHLDALPSPAALPSFEAVGGVGLLIIYAFTGFENATLTAGETKDAKRSVPGSLLAAIAGMGLLYFLLQLAYVATMQGERPEGAPLEAAARALGGPSAAAAITIAAIVSIGANLLAATLAVPRLSFALAEQKLLPAWFGQVSARFGTPANSILALGLIAGALALSGGFVWLAIISALARVSVYAISIGALWKLRGIGKTAIGLVSPFAAAALCMWAAAQAKPDAWLFLAGFVVFGWALYGLGRWRRGETAHI